MKMLLGVVISGVCFALSSCGASNFIQNRYFKTFQESIVVLGQRDASSGNPDGGRAISASTFNKPQGNVAEDAEGRLYVADTNNFRVLRFTRLPTENGAAADLVLGAPNFVSKSAATSASGFQNPVSAQFDDGKLYVLDSGAAKRLMVWNSTPASSGVAADLAIGAADLNSVGGSCNNAEFAQPLNFSIAKNRLFVADMGGGRVMAYNSVPATPAVVASFALGQSTFTSCAQNDVNQDGIFDVIPSSASLREPGGVWTDGTRVMVLDSGNSRVLIWKQFPKSFFEPADIVLGQSDFTHRISNDDDQDDIDDGKASARTLSYPRSLTVYGERLIVADSGNNRVLIWDSVPTSNFAPADVVIGQSDFTKNAANDDDQNGVPDATPSARTLSTPSGVTILSDGTLMVVDRENHRVLGFQPKP